MHTISVRVSGDDYALITAFAATQGLSRGAVFLDLLDLLRPQMQNVLRLSEAAKTLMPASKEEIRRAIDLANAEIVPKAAEVMLAFNELMESVEGASAPQGDGSPSMGDGGGGPPSSNTGVRSGRGRGVSGSGKGRGYAI